MAVAERVPACLKVSVHILMFSDTESSAAAQRSEETHSPWNSLKKPFVFIYLLIEF